MNQYIQPHFSQSALITIDMQNDFTLVDAPLKVLGTLAVVENIQQLLVKYRQLGRPIIHVVRLYERGGDNADVCRKQRIEAGEVLVAPNTDGAELVDGLTPNATVRLDSEQLLAGQFQQIGDNEWVMYKPRWGAFYQTDLQEFLQARDINTLVFSGCNYPNCPRTSMYQASERDYRVVLATDALSQLYAKGEEELSNIGIQLLSTKDLIGLLSNA